MIIQPLDGEPPFVFERTEDDELDAVDLRGRLREFTIVTFNGQHFDFPLLALALTGASCGELKAASNKIIGANMQPWQFEKVYKCKIPKVDHIDLIEVAPGTASLKIYGGRLHCKTMQDLPFEHDATLSRADMDVVRSYCANDLEVTALLHGALREQIELRERLSEQYSVDLRSKSDAQIAEAIIRTLLEGEQDTVIAQQKDWSGEVFRYRKPNFISFQDPTLVATLEMIRAAQFRVSAGGKVMMPELKNLKVTIGGKQYRMGVGGLHSCEEKQVVIPRPNQVLCDYDVASYYPAAILNLGLYPTHLGPNFLKVYRGIVERRLEAKRAGDKVTADTLKIVINGSFGKFGSKWSFLYSPNLLIQTTITGQLSLLMLIEMLEARGLKVMSANTDGIVVLADRSDLELMRNLVAGWGMVTGFDTEETEYISLHSRDVNNYIARKAGSVKLKGAYAMSGLSKNPTNTICVDAVLAWLTHQTPIADTVNACQDIRKFLTIRKVTGGAVKNGEILGRAVRWYYSTFATGVIQCRLNGFTVPRSENAAPLMTLPPEIPHDLDRDWYVREAWSIVEDLGYSLGAKLQQEMKLG